MNLKPKEVEEEWYDDQANCASCEMPGEVNKRQSSLSSINVKQIPQIDEHSATNCEEGERSNIFRRDDTAHRDARQQEPFPPLATKRVMTELVEANIGEHTDCHEEDQGSIQQDQSCLTNVCVVEEDKACR